jgi:copper resistance protein C
MSPSPRRPTAVLARLVVVGASLASIAFTATAESASAHAAFISSEPRANARVTALPERVVIHVAKKQATREGDPIQVFDPNGVRIDNGETLVSDGGGTISVGLVAGGRRSGAYNVVYTITSADTHIIQNRFTFSLTPLSNETLNAASSGGTVRTDPPSALAATPGGLRVVGPPGGSYLGTGLVTAAIITLLVMIVRRRRAPADITAPGFRVVSTGEHHLGPVPGPALPSVAALPEHQASPGSGTLGSARSVALPPTTWSTHHPEPLHPTPGAR